MKSYHFLFPWILQKIGYVIFFCILKLFVRLEIRGREHLVGLAQPVILAANHTSEIDPAIFALIFPLFSKHFPLYFVSNPAEKFKTFGWRSYFYGGAFFNMLGAYPIISGKHNYAIALQNHIFLLRKKQTVCIFPEGRRTKDGTLSVGHGGVAYLAYTASTSVVPIAINTFFGLEFNDFIFRKRKVIVIIGSVMSPDMVVPEKNPQVEDFKRGGQRIMDEIEQMM